MRNFIGRFVIIYVLWVVVVVVAFIFMLNTAIQASLTDRNVFGTAFILSFVIMFGGLGAPWIIFWVLFSRKPNWTKDVLANGKEATATIVGIGDTGVSMGRSTFYVTLRLNVQPANESAFEASIERAVSRVDVPRVGDTFQVRYDPGNNTHLVVLGDPISSPGYSPALSALPTGRASGDIGQELTALAQLHQRGDLSDAEYEIAKKKLLG